MKQKRLDEIQEMVDRESRAYETGDSALMLTLFHPDMVWAWPPHAKAHDPMEWILRMGRFDYDRWFRLIQLFFDTHTLVHNHRVTRKIVLSEEMDGAFAVVDVDTLFRQNPAADSPWHKGENMLHTKGRACKTYTLVNEEWKMIAQPGTMHYPVGT